jgi:hypothetical protein
MLHARSTSTATILLLLATAGTGCVGDVHTTQDNGVVGDELRGGRRRRVDAGAATARR